MDHRALRHCKARFAIDLHPSHCSDAMGGVQEQLSAWLLRCASPSLQGDYVFLVLDARIFHLQAC